MKYLALDVETAAAMPWSVCQIGVVGFDAVGETEAFGTLVQPGCVFAPFNIRIHGIDDDRVAGAPDFVTAFSALAPRLDGAIVVSHTFFDRGALTAACERFGADMPDCLWLDSVRIARRAWPGLAGGYRLANLARHLGIRFRHHDATEDARTCGLIVHHALRETGLDLQGMVRALGR
ncbi:exonuclease domain-containing protein [Zavarzinia aquatilis]|uniref:Exonuclease n=1 Tax=Zavarzinia aquatilis TaxID=2211142 RepID=A0A317DX27_9PROT|nr:exonuclease domain-containing protein [Zavarzinia aquatilis]PWR18490.1 exonuclease [Zavarzinia aquatilis]